MSMEASFSSPDVINVRHQLSKLAAGNYSFTRMKFVKQLTTAEIISLNQLATHISSLLPRVSDTSIYYIDDILYGEHDSGVVPGTNLASIKNIQYLVENCFGDILIIFVGEKNKFSRVFEMVFLQFLEIVSIETLIGTYLSGIWKTFLTDVLNFDISAERYLKVLKILTDKLWSQDWIEKYLSFPHNETLVSKFLAPLCLPYFPINSNSVFGNMHEMRRALFLSGQSSAIAVLLKTSGLKWETGVINYFDMYTRKKEIRYDSKFIGLLLRYVNKDQKIRNKEISISFYINILHNYFSSARDEEEKVQRIQDFVRGMCKYRACEPWGSTLLKDCITKIKKYSKRIADGILHLFKDLEKYPYTYIMKLQRRYEYNNAPYLSKCNICSAYLTFKEETVEFVKKYFGSSNYSDDNDISRKTLDDGEKVSFYHKFMKGLQLLEILHESWLMLDDIEDLKDINPGLITEIFRPKDSPIKLRINEYITDPSKRGRVDWWIPFLLMKCPFLIQSYRCESQMKNLILLLSGKKTDKVTEETLYMTINTIC